MTMMRAIARRNDQPDDITLIEMPRPTPDANQLLVRVYTAGVGIHDSYWLPENLTYPYPIGIEASGVIEEIGADVTEFSVGQAVTFVSAMQAKGGTWADYAVVDSDALIVPIPEGMSFEQASTFPVAGNTILKAFHALALKPGQTLFIAGGSGAIGSFAIQIAVQRGVTVAASASPRNHAFMRELGAELTVDYKDENWTEQLRAWRPEGVDAALAINPGTSAECLPLVKDNGHFVTVSLDEIEAARGITVSDIPHHIDIKEEMRELMQKTADGKFHVELAGVLPIEQGLEALAQTQTRSARGKRVLVMKQAS